MPAPPAVWLLCIEIYARAANATETVTSTRGLAEKNSGAGGEAAKTKLTYSTHEWHQPSGASARKGDRVHNPGEIIWHKPNPMPESVKDRPTRAHEQIFLLSKSPNYYYNHEAIKEPFSTDPKENYPKRARIIGRGAQPSSCAPVGNPQQDRSGGFPPNGDGRNKRSVWTMTTKPFKGAHFAVFPPDLPRTCMLAGCPEGGVVLDPFSGAATTGIVAVQHGRQLDQKS